ncbi:MULTISPECIES: acyl-CoA dehydrogenase family protein [Actinosynnema]|uniref:acyl-CoA dehydrogenase family protein n=1 Tax=Actinosynnema TaxID=40566 RepID=UPI0020A444D9|nr:acyl-CoA dehydrogenase family protein [Actinosynnema pretiosum]MCP2092333.1 Acyl-CoA dehydrogenase [Actinosynnema pretiosum]
MSKSAGGFDFSAIAARAAEVDATGVIPEESWAELASSGYLRLFHPEEIGGANADGPTQAAAMEQLAAACPSTFWSTTVSGLLCAKLISTYGDVATHERLLRPIVSGEKVVAFGVVERASGSDAGTYRTTVRPDGDGFALRGEKARITNAPNADLAVVLARRADADGRVGDGWCLAFVDLHQPGVERDSLPHMGLRGMPWGVLKFDDARVSAENVVPVPFDMLSEGMAWGWLLIGISSVAIAETAVRASAEHALSRESFGRPLAHMEGVHAQLADSLADVQAARLLAVRAMTERAQGRSAKHLIGALKAYATEMAVDVVTRAVQIHGAFGVTAGHPVERMYRDAQMNVIGGFATNRLREQMAENLGLGPAAHADFDWVGHLKLDPVPLDGAPA